MMKKVKIIAILFLFFSCAILLSGCMGKKKVINENINVSVEPGADDINFKDLNIDLGVEGIEVQEVN